MALAGLDHPQVHLMAVRLCQRAQSEQQVRRLHFAGLSPTPFLHVRFQHQTRLLSQPCFTKGLCGSCSRACTLDPTPLNPKP